MLETEHIRCNMDTSKLCKKKQDLYFLFPGSRDKSWIPLSLCGSNRIKRFLTDSQNVK